MYKGKTSEAAGLNATLRHNKTARPNDDLLNTLKAAAPQFFDKDGNFKADKFEDELKKNNIAEARDGYKLGFVGKDYARLQVGLKSETMIVPDCKHNALPDNAKSGNVFITGDNLDALRHLANAYGNQIKLIYIDPPYNTGKEFVYSDKFEFNDEKLKSILGYTGEEIARLKSIQGKSSHSAWLTFMYPRLKIAQRLLKDDGVIFVSIDDNEQANLKLLMDDVFGEGNFVGIYIKRSKVGGGSDSKHIVKEHEYCVVYARNIETLPEMFINHKDEYLKRYNEEDENGRYFWDTFARPGLKHPIVYNITAPDGTIITNGWIRSKERFEQDYKNGSVRVVRKSDGDWSVQFKQYLNAEGKKPRSMTMDFGGTIEGKNEIGELFDNEKIFLYPKSTIFIKELLKTTINKEDIILDFFAGSATTAHAVMQLNAEDGGNRKFIMVQLDEETNPDSDARKAGYNTIDEIARERICRAGKKIVNSGQRMVNSEEHSENYSLFTNSPPNRCSLTANHYLDIGFKHYRLITPDVKTLEKIVSFNPEETNLIADDMIKPFECKETETGGLDTILTTWLIDDGYRFDTSVEEIIFGNYKARYAREALTLYLINMGWNTAALKDMLNQIGKNKLLVKTIVVYPYSFEFEAMRELKTNIKTNLDNPPNLIERF